MGKFRNGNEETVGSMSNILKKVFNRYNLGAIILIALVLVLSIVLFKEVINGEFLILYEDTGEVLKEGYGKLYLCIAGLLSMLLVSVAMLEEDMPLYILNNINSMVNKKLGITEKDEENTYEMKWVKTLEGSELIRDFKYSYKEYDVYEELNREIELSNGYCTRIYNVMCGDKEGIKTTTKVKILRNTKEDNYKKLLITDKELKTEEDLKYVYDTLYRSHKLDEENDTTMKYYKKLKEDDEERLNQLNYINKNLEDNNTKGKEMKGMLLEGFSNKQKEGIQYSINKTLKEIREDISKIKI